MFVTTDRARQDAQGGVRNIEFPSARRGYERAAVDRYIEQGNRLIAESAVRHALEEVSEETRGLRQARRNLAL